MQGPTGYPQFNPLSKPEAPSKWGCRETLITLLVVSIFSIVLVAILQNYPEASGAFYAIAGSIGGVSLLALLYYYCAKKDGEKTSNGQVPLLNQIKT